MTSNPKPNAPLRAAALTSFFTRYSRLQLTAVGVVLALLATVLQCGWLPFIYVPGYTPKTMTTVNTPRTTHCIGRYLIDLPSEFELSTGGWGNIMLYYGLGKDFERVYATVEPGLYTNEAFWEKVNKRRFKLEDEKNDFTKGAMLLHGEQINTSSALLRRLGDKSWGLSIKTEVHVLVGQRYVTLEQESYSKDNNDVTYTNADPAPAEARLKMIASKLLHYENAARAKPGFCMQGVLFDVGQDDEQATFHFRAKSVPDLNIAVDYHAVTGQPSAGILERSQDTFRKLPGLLLAVGTLREGIKQMGGVSAEESLLKVVRPITQHVFDIERRDTQPSTLNRPHFGIRLSTGNEYETPISEAEGKATRYATDLYYDPARKAMRHGFGNSILSDTQVIKLWDDLVASVRKR